MRRALVIVGLISALGIAATAAAAVKNFSWTPPTENEDGTELRPEDIAGYSINCGHVAGGPYDVVNLRAAGGLTTSYMHELAPGEWYCTARTIVGAPPEEVMSVRSNEVFFIVARPNPRAPADFSAN